MKTRDTPIPAPEFEMADAEGKIVRLADYRRKKHVVLVFNRSMM
jgi:peroxiredoxin